MIAVDTNTLAYYWIPGVHSAVVEQVFLKDPDWVTSPLWKYEFRNTLAGYIRKNLILPADAIQIIEEAERKMDGKEIYVPPSQNIKLIQQSKCSGYDCEFVAIAENLGVPLVTSDKLILSQFPGVAKSPEDFLK